MFWTLLGILLGIIIGLNTNFSIPIEYIKYTAVIIVGVFDSLLGAIRAEVTHEVFKPNILLSGIFFNILLAVGLTYLGEQLGLDLYLAATVAFTLRIFTNMGQIRRALLEKLDKKSGKA